jgi:hypothetical protein
VQQRYKSDTDIHGGNVEKKKKKKSKPICVVTSMSYCVFVELIVTRTADFQIENLGFE